MTNIKYLPLGMIETEGMQIRVKMDPDVVMDYAEAMSAGSKFPPVVVYFDGNTYYLADGFHRLQAAQHLNLLKIACEVRDGSAKDARWAACGMNVAHGLRRTNADKRRVVTVALELRPDWTDRRLAEYVGVSHPFVSEMRQLVTVTSSKVNTPRPAFGPPPPPPRRFGLDGRVRRLPPVPVKPVDPVGDEQSSVNSGELGTNGTIEADEEHGDGDGAVDDGDTAGLVDVFKQHVPEELAPLWRRRREVQEVLTWVSKIKGILKRAQESQDPLWAEVNFSSALITLDSLFTEISATKPYVVCPMCQGIGCRACKERGLLGKYRYDQVIPRELKVKVRTQAAQ